MNNDTSFDIIQESNPVQTVAQPKEDNEMLRATDRITALYCRLSVEDTKEDKKNGKEDLSNSIQNQKAILLQYARDHRFPHPTFFIDDGYSGVDFNNRPGFQKMLAEIEAGNVGTVITKDLSRLGRNSSLTGLYINYTFPQNDVRYIAINDHFDTINPNSTDSDIAGIKNWFNEFFCKGHEPQNSCCAESKGRAWREIDRPCAVWLLQRSGGQNQVDHRRRSGAGGQKDFHALYERTWTEPNCRTA